jgi:hypothetical protein
MGGSDRNEWDAPPAAPNYIDRGSFWRWFRAAPVAVHKVTGTEVADHGWVGRIPRVGLTLVRVTVYSAGADTSPARVTWRAWDGENEVFAHYRLSASSRGMKAALLEALRQPLQRATIPGGGDGCQCHHCLGRRRPGNRFRY